MPTYNYEEVIRQTQIKGHSTNHLAVLKKKKIMKEKKGNCCQLKETEEI